MLKKDLKELKWIVAAAGRKGCALVVLLAVLSMVTGFVGVASALFMRSLVDSAANGDKSGFFRVGLICAGAAAVQIIIGAVKRRLDELTSADIENNIRMRLFGTLLDRDYAQVSANHSGEWINRLTNDAGVVANSFTAIFPSLLGMIVRLVSALVMLFTLDRRIGFVIVPCGVVLMVITALFRKTLRKMHKEVQEKEGRTRVFFQEALGSLLMIRAFGAEEDMSARTSELLADTKRSRMKRVRFSSFTNTGFSAAMTGMYMAGIIYCAYGILNGIMTYGTLTAVAQLIGQIQSPFAGLTGFIPRYYSMTASASRIIEAENIPHETEQESLSAEDIASLYNDRLNHISFKGVGFTYPPRDGEENPPVLTDFSLDIGKGEHIAIKGTSGCGKSTVIKLLLAVYRPDSGEIILDTAEGDIPLDPAHRGLFAYVPQGNRLMNTTVREVVTFGQKDTPDDDTIYKALKTACADEFVSQLENGLDTKLGERGAGISEGQAQRLAIARAICADRPILLLDEATSALDEQTERRVLENLRQDRDKTVIIITHRPAALEICDKIVEM